MEKLFNPLIFKIILKRLWERKLRLFLLMINMLFSFLILLTFITVSLNVKSKSSYISSNSLLSHQVVIEKEKEYKINDLITLKGVTEYRIFYKTNFEYENYTSSVHLINEGKPILFDKELEQLNKMEISWGQGSLVLGELDIIVTETFLENYDIKFDLGDKIKIRQQEFELELTLIGIISKQALYALPGLPNTDFIVNRNLTNQEIDVTTIVFNNYRNLSFCLDILQDYKYSYTSDYEFIKDLEFFVNMIILLCYFLGTFLAFICLLSLYSSINASIKEKEKLVCLLYNLGMNKRKIQRLFLFELFIIGFITYFLSLIILLTISLIFINNYSIIFLELQFNDILILNPIAILLTFITIILLLFIIYLKPIKKLSIKRPSQL